MKRRISILLAILLIAALSAAAEDATVPEVLHAGFAAYKSDGAQAAIKTWLKASSLEGSKEALSQANMLSQIQDFYGPFKSYDVIQAHMISPAAEIIYVTINFEHGPVFGKFLLFKQTDRWIVPSFELDTKPEKVLPASLVHH